MPEFVSYVHKEQVAGVENPLYLVFLRHLITMKLHCIPSSNLDPQKPSYICAIEEMRRSRRLKSGLDDVFCLFSRSAE